jgi:hypothetical protein
MFRKILVGLEGFEASWCANRARVLRSTAPSTFEARHIDRDELASPGQG